MKEKTIYFDCFAGVCGSMILGALVDAGLDVEFLKEELSRLPVGGYEIIAENVKKHSIGGTLIRVVAEKETKHRHLKHIVSLIDESTLSPSVKTKSKEIFQRLAEAEARIHRTTTEKVHFHETGAVDAIVDIVGSVIGFEKLGIQRIISSAIATGKGFVRCDHGVMPVPAPATVELLKNIPFYSGEIEAELTTPTGAAILSTLSESFGPLPEFETEIVAYGAGEYDLPIPNLLRIYIGTAAKMGAGESDSTQQDRVYLLETNIDDMNPQFYERVFEILQESGALDVYLTPIIMKKNRPGTLLNVLFEKEKLPEISKQIFMNTTTIGVRLHEVSRMKLQREMKSVDTPYGSVTIKVARFDGVISGLSPEYEDCRRLAVEKGVSVMEVYEGAKVAARTLLSGDGNK